MMMAGSKELKCASEAMEQIKVHRARFQEALMWRRPQKRLRTVPRGSTYQGKLSSSILTTMLSSGIAALAHRTKEIACQDAKQIAQQIVTYGPKNGSKIGPSKWVPCNQLINLSCIWKLGMAPKTGSEKRHRNEGLTEQKRKRTFDSWARPCLLLENVERCWRKRRNQPPKMCPPLLSKLAKKRLLVFDRAK